MPRTVGSASEGLHQPLVRILARSVHGAKPGTCRATCGDERIVLSTVESVFPRTFVMTPRTPAFLSLGLNLTPLAGTFCEPTSSRECPHLPHGIPSDFFVRWLHPPTDLRSLVLSLPHRTRHRPLFALTRHSSLRIMPREISRSAGSASREVECTLRNSCTAA